MPSIKSGLILASGIALASCTAPAAAANWLIGKWHLVSHLPNTNPNWMGPMCAYTDMAYTAKAAINLVPGPATPIAVTYLVGPRRIVASSANDVIYFWIDANHIQLDDGAKCTYQRVG